MLPRRPVFLDTSGWYALATSRAVHHPTAVRRFRRVTGQGRPVVTTNQVAGESYTLVLRRLGVQAAHVFLRQLRGSSILRRVFVPEAWEQDAERLLEQYDDQPFSYVDATSFVTMRRLGIQEALAFDQDFVVAGFTLLGDD
jgi:predicted nucleic acid-binding protein